MDAAHIRNFSIIAHIDHGKTTLSDRLLHSTGTIATRDMEDQLLDSMDLERERGITIKAHPVTMLYKSKNGEIYELNLIDTPGHVDFSYEVSRSLAACEGALLIIDAAQGVEAQTVANVHLAMKQNLAIIPVINKIDLPHADVALAKMQLEDILAIPADTAILASAKQGIGIEDVLEAIVARVPPPKPTGEASLQALGFDSYFDTYKGVVTHVRVFNGELKAGMQVKLLHSGKTVEVKEVGSFNPKPYPRERLEVGETGYFTANIKSPKEVKMGDTITDARSLAGAAGLQRNSSDGVQRNLSDQYGGLRTSQSESGETAIERFRVCFSERKFSCVGVWFSLRVSRFVASGNCAGTFAARIRHGHHRDLSERGLSSHDD